MTLTTNLFKGAKMLRRDFLVGSAASAAVLAVAPSVLAEPTLPDLGLFPRQEMMRQRARTASEVHLLWGQRSGKARTTAAIAADRVCTRGATRICLVGHSTWYTDSYSRQIEDDVYMLGGPRRHLTFVGFTPEVFMTQTNSFDIVILNDVDWFYIPAHKLIDRAREISPFFASESTPCRRNSDYMNYVLFHGSMGHIGDAWDWASSWEVNPLISRASLMEERSIDPERWDRDFLAYKQHAIL